MAGPCARNVRTATFLVLLVVTFGRAAPAAEPALQAVGETSLGYLDSSQSPPDGGPGRVRSRGLTWVLAPALVLDVSTQRVQQRLGYRYQHDFLFGDSFTS